MRVAAALLLLVVASIGPATAQQYEFKMISSGRNRPGIPLWNSPYRDILVGLHAGARGSALAAAAGVSEARLATALDSLRREGAVVQRDGAPHPTCMVVTPEEGASLAQLATQVATQALPFMRSAVTELQSQYRKIAGLRHLAFGDVSFFLASDVLLDNWQINAVEERWLHAPRPLRGSSRYYCAYLAHTDDNQEAFGIYGNQMYGLGPSRLLGVYGNRRGGGRDLGSLSRSHLATLVGAPDSTSRGALLRQLMDDLQRWAGDSAAFDGQAALVNGLRSMGLVRAGRPLFAVLDSTDETRLEILAASVTDSLVAHLERATPQLRETWTASRWHGETTFDEFRIWWYHFFYTALTNELAAEGAIRVPETGLFHYLMVP